MPGYQIALKVETEVVARNLIGALKAYGFHPMESGDGGFPGARGLISSEGIPIALPEEELADGKLLAESLLKEMLAR